jgi:hypothetical protein
MVDNKDWEERIEKKQLRILKGQALNLATGIVLYDYSLSKAGITEKRDVEVILQMAELIFRVLKEKNWNRL